MTSLLAAHLFDYALNTLWQLPLLAASTWLLIRLARPSVAVQHALWIATLLLAATLPLRTPPAVIRPAVLEAQPALTLPTPYPVVLTLPRPTVLQTFLHPHPITISSHLIRRIAQLWLILFAFNLLSLTQAWLTSRRLITRATPSTLDPTFLVTCASRLNIPTPKVLLSDSATIPVVAGIFHPVLLLPARFEHDYELTAILLHEFAHIRRRDTLTNLLCRLVALPIAWHPVTPLFHARIGQTRELLCDALAAHAAGSSTDYARSLLTLARSIQEDDIPSTTQPSLATLALYRNPSHLEERIMKLITPPAATPANRTARIAAGIALTVAATCTAAAFHLQAVSAAQRPSTIARLIPASIHPFVQAPIHIAYAISDTPSTPHRTICLQARQDAPAPPPLPPLPAMTATLPPLPPITPAVAPIAPTPPVPNVDPVPQVAPTAPVAPVAPQAPAPAPAAPPAPAPTHHAHVVVNGVERDLTPAERAEVDKQLAAAQEQIHKALNQKFIDEKAFSAQLKALNSGEIQRQIADAQKQINSPEFQKQIAEASKLAADKAANSEDFRRQMDQAMQQIKIAQASIANQKLDIHIDQARIQHDLKLASESVANIKLDTPINVHIDTAQIQKQLEAARKQLEEARRNNQQPQP